VAVIVVDIESHQCRNMSENKSAVRQCKDQDLQAALATC